MLDLVLSGGWVIDGTGAPRRRADVGVQGDAIAAVGDLSASPARSRMDVTGLVVAPGFIDSHTHSDGAFVCDPDNDIKLRQGVTTETVGHCGMSLAPVSDAHLGLAREFLAAITGGAPLDWGWRSHADLRRRVEQAPARIHSGWLVGHGTLRAAVMGFDRRPAGAAELERMADLLDAAMEAGALGLSFGLWYPPGSFSRTEELIALGRVVSRRRGICAIHMRNEMDHVVEAVEESLRIAEEAAVPFLISHFKSAGRRNWGKVHTTIAMLEVARDRGLPVAMDMYPYTAGSSLLSSIMPAWVHEGGVAGLLARLRIPAERARLVHELETWEQGLGLTAGWDNTVVAMSESHPGAEGLNIAEVARHLGTTPGEAVCRLVEDDEGRTLMVIFIMSEEDVETVLRHPLCMIGSDGIHSPGKVHPRLYGTFPRVLGHYVRDRRAFSLEEAVHKMTGLPAQFMRLGPRGRILAGLGADLTVFDPERVADRSTYSDPRRYPDGIECVVVGGAVAVAGGAATAVRSGTYIQRS